MECRISISPHEGNENKRFEEPPRIKIDSKPPKGTSHDNHPAFDHEIKRDVRQAFEETIPIGEQLEFLNNCDYPYQYPTIAKVEWYPEYTLAELVDRLQTTEEFDSKI